MSAARLQQANALVSLSRSTISVFGPAVSGLIVATAGAEWVFGINGASFVVSAFFLARLSVPERERGPSKAFFADLAEGWREVRSRPWVAAALVNFSIVNIGIASYFVLGPLIVEEELSGASSWAIAMTGGSIGGILGAMIALRFKPTYPLRWSFGLIAFTAIQLLGLIPPLPAVGLAVLALFTVASIQISGTFWNTTLQQRIPEHVLSRVVAYDWLVSLVFMPLGYVAAAPLADAIGTDTTLIGLAALNASACIGVLLVPSVRNMRRPDADATPDERTQLIGSEALKEANPA